jgi:hypothetical protein
MLRNFKQWTFLKKSVVGFTSFVVAVVAGLITNAVTPFFTSVLTWAMSFLQANLWWLIAIILLAIITFLIHTQKIGKLQKKLEDDKQVFKQQIDYHEKIFNFIGSSLLHALPDFIPLKNSADLEKKVISFMKDILADLTTLPPEVYGASLFLPHPIEKDYLTIWTAYQVPEDSMRLAKCYIGPNHGIKRGVAGECYLSRKLLVAHRINRKDMQGNWIFDSDNYVHFPKSKTLPAFKSLVCIPLVETSTDDNPSPKCLGVLSFDSEILTAFDSPILQETLALVGNYIASVLLIYESLKKRSP